MAELLTQLLHLVIAATLGIIGVEYEPVREEAVEAQTAEIQPLIQPAVYSIRAKGGKNIRVVMNSCDNDGVDLHAYDAEKPLFIGVTGYQS